MSVPIISTWRGQTDFALVNYANLLKETLMAQGHASNGWRYAVAEHHLYGSSRVGLHQTHLQLRERKPDLTAVYATVSTHVAFYRGKRNYELSNHLGNVMATISDKRRSVCNEELGIAYFEAEVLTQTDYYPFGSVMPNRQWSAGAEGYRYGFNGKESDSETGFQDYGFRIYYPAIGKFLSVDPLVHSYLWYTPYQFAGNKCIGVVDLDGLEEFYASSGELIGKFGNSTEVRVVYESYTEIVKSLINQPTLPTAEVVKVYLEKYSAGTFTSSDEAATDWAVRYNPISIESNREYSSFIVAMKLEGKEKKVLTYLEPEIGGENSAEYAISVSKKRLPIAHIHSHAAYSEEYNNNHFSTAFIDKEGNWKPGDIDGYKENGLIGYVSTPNGSLLQFNPVSETTKTISCDIPFDKSDPTSPKPTP